ncbi:histidine kinase [Paenibacillus sp. J5C_2022]|uniref:sensor histidine kinase n=1 Tax=Paenibacillus sp. J5C2022 TaxID=2977129 RepID=UPI0021D1EA44|nr:sensor histidine kinase [Paenibacillus sp. J5C2022]MCU6709590.1 histidine kinase [Paenibacillus sp. J5C2022]
MKRRAGSMTFKLFVTCLVFVLVCVAIISHLSSQFVRNHVEERDQEFINQILLKVNEYLALNFVSMQSLIFSVDSYLDTTDFDEVKLGQYLDQLYGVNIQYISNIYVIKEDYSIIGGRTITRVVNEPLAELEPVYRIARQSAFRSTISMPYDNRFTGRTVTLARKSKYNDSLVVAVDINIRELETKLLQIHEEEQIQLYIADYGGNIVASSKDDSVAAGMDRIGGMSIAQLIEADNTVMRSDSGSRTESLFVKLHSPVYNWLLVAVSDGSRLSRILDDINGHFIRLILFGLLLSLITAMTITRYIRKPVYDLVHKMKQVERGKLEVSSGKARNDEFGYLSRTFDRMLRQINDLFQNAKEQKELQAKLEMQVLQAQINPHFLYNTLGAISHVVRLGKLDKVDPVIASLISILEYGIKDPSYKISLQEELNNVRDYITIQNIRYDRDFKLIEAIDPELQEFKVFRMFLQPIVENSIFHGYRGGREEGAIHIEVYRGDNRVVVDVIDHGIGIDEEKIDHLLKPGLEERERDSEGRERIGLANIHGRIKLHYGMNYGLRILRAPGKGTCVRAEFPIPDEEGDKGDENQMSDCG